MNRPPEYQFQPLVNLSAGRIIGFTAHQRARADCDDDLLRSACRAAVRWPDGFVLGVALVPAQWRDTTTGLRVLSILGETGLPPGRLELEITESTLDSDTREIHHMIDGLRQAGVMIALSGYGAGATLPPFCFDTLKLDCALVARLGQDNGNDNDMIVDALIGMAEQHGLVTAAEGIASAAQLALLNAKGCAEGQGDLFGGPIAGSDIPALLRYPSIAHAVA